jgi:flavin reductase (DIM6/NTAB) family NADH-FMN oxidoreductase RutF
MKKEIDVFDYASYILKTIKKGVLLTTKSENKVNSMTISWGTFGIKWGKPIFIAFVREHRFTKEQLESNPEFTVNIPYGKYNKKILGFCGSKSGRFVDKIKEMDLTLETPEVISAPALKELPLTLECKVIYKQMQDKDAIPQNIRVENYPQDVDSTSPFENKDYHIAYYGEVVKAYIIE